jgi:hypothetical protein
VNKPIQKKCQYCDSPAVAYKCQQDRSDPIVLPMHTSEGMLNSMADREYSINPVCSEHTAL